MPGLFNGAVAYCSVGSESILAPFAMFQQSGDFEEAFTVEDPDAYTLIYNLTLKNPISPADAIYIATARVDPIALPGTVEQITANVSTLTDTTIRVVTWTFPPPVLGLDAPVAFAAPPINRFGFDLVILVKPSV
jgi:hypothetical protein